MDADFCRQQLAVFTERVRTETERTLPRFYCNPGEFENSEAWFRMITLITVLVFDCGLKYNMAKASPETVLTPDDSFIFGLIQGDGGNCISIPTMVISIGRRLGYPLKLVMTREHGFVRWEGSDGTRHNFKAGQNGLSWYPDDHYRKWPKEWSEQAGRDCGYLQTFNRAHELGYLLSTRAGFWRDRGFRREAIECWAWAAELQSIAVNALRFAQDMHHWKEAVRPVSRK